jgi:hypothetical protein
VSPDDLDDRMGPIGTSVARGASGSPAQARAHAAALAELRRQPRAVSWRRDALRTLLVVLATTGLVVGAAIGSSIVDFAWSKQRLVSLGLLVSLQALAVVAAIAPGQRALRWVAAVLAALAAGAVVIGRGAGPPGAPAIPCSAVHLAIDLIPLGVVLLALRRFAWSLARSALAGAAAAATGALAGELSCSRGAAHALVHHIGAGLLIVAACVLLSRMRRPETFAS